MVATNSNERSGADPRKTLRARARRSENDAPIRVSSPTNPRKRTSTRKDTAGASGDSAQVAGGPARGYSWPPFEKGNQLAVGNTAALVHGATSPRAIAERAELVHAHLIETCPWLDEPRYAPSLQRYLTATAREQLAHEAYMAEPTKARLLEAATAAARLAWSIGAELGLTPAGHARLRILTAGGEHAEASLHDLAAEGRRIRERAAARQDVALAPVVELPGTDVQEDDDDA